MLNVLEIVRHLRGQLVRGKAFKVEGKESVNYRETLKNNLKSKVESVEKVRVHKVDKQSELLYLKISEKPQCMFKSVSGDLIFIPNLKTGKVDGCELLVTKITGFDSHYNLPKLTDVEHGYKNVREDDFIKMLNKYNGEFISIK